MLKVLDRPSTESTGSVTASASDPVTALLAPRVATGGDGLEERLDLVDAALPRVVLRGPKPGLAQTAAQRRVIEQPTDGARDALGIRIRHQAVHAVHAEVPIAVRVGAHD